jgi:hypothetical protein
MWLLQPFLIGDAKTSSISQQPPFFLIITIRASSCSPPPSRTLIVVDLYSVYSFCDLPLEAPHIRFAGIRLHDG